MSLAIGLRSLFCVLGCLMLATLIYTLCVDGFPFRKDVLTPWMSATLIDFYINVVALGAWVCYKESNWISASLWIVLLVCFGSITTCFYIVLQFLKLPNHDALGDPIHYVLLRNPTKDGVEDKRRFSVVTTRSFFGALGCLMLATLVYTLLTDGSPFRGELFTPPVISAQSYASMLEQRRVLPQKPATHLPLSSTVRWWMTATLIDFYINVVALSVWVAYKESSWLNAFIWIVLLICFGSITTCTYIVRQLFHLLSQDPVYLVLLKSSNRQV